MNVFAILRHGTFQNSNDLQSNRRKLHKNAWEKGVIGIWFGAWVPGDLKKIANQPAERAALSLSSLPAQRKLKWKISSRHINTIRRFEGIESEDWVFAYYDQCLHVARVESSILAEEIKEFGRNGETFKARRIGASKSFRLDQLPESFRLLSCAGRGTLHEVGSTRLLIEMLVENDLASSIIQAYGLLDWKDWLDALGPRGWETISLAYLIQVKQFLPTGVGVGGTLADFDIVGRDKSGKRVLAQCKKTPSEHNIEEKEKAAYMESTNADVYLFAYNGAKNVPANVSLITREDIDNWFATASGRQYLHLLTS